MKVHLSRKLYAHKVTGMQFPFHYRPETSDEKCMVEVLDQECYAHSKLGFRPEAGEHWLDLGGNIGAFSFWCIMHGATVTVFEPDPLNFKILTMNTLIQTNGSVQCCPVNAAVTVHKKPKLTFYSGVAPGDFYRGSCIPPPTVREMHDFSNICIRELSKVHYDGIKMDIEGSEFPIIDQGLLPPCNKLVLEYHLSYDPDMAHFRRRIKLLKKRFRTVYYIESMDQQYPDDKYPGKFDRLVWCLNPKK